MGWLIAAIIVVLLWCAFRLARLATRLDRLHRRTEAAWAALDVALAKRSGVARAVAATAGLDQSVAAAIGTAVRRTDSTVRVERADAENELTKALEQLATLPEEGVSKELQEAAQRIMLARRFYNDAVRDTRALRGNRFSRMFRLAGRAQLPDYFEIAEYNPSKPLTRVAARILLVDEADRVLMFSGGDPHREGRWWFTPGGGVEPGEDLVGAARRELAEETGLAVAASALVGPLWWRRARFHFVGIEYDQTEYFYAVAAPVGDLRTDGFTDLERASIDGHGWFTAEEVRHLDGSVYPVELAVRLPAAVAALRSGWEPTDPVQID